MPRTFSSFLDDPKAPLEYGDGYPIHSDFPALILKALAAHAGIDSARSMTFLCMLHSQAHMAALIYNRLMITGNLIPVMNATAEAYFGPEQLDFYYGVCSMTAQTDKSRNVLAHSYYMGSPSIGDDGILLLSPRHWVLQSGEWVTLASLNEMGNKAEGQIAKWAAPFNPDEMMVYSRGDLEAMRDEMSKAQDAWLAFGVWVWPKLCPVRLAFDPMTFLVAQRTVMRVVDKRRVERKEPPFQQEPRI